MKNKKTTIKYKPNSPLNYQFGGGLSFLDPYLSLGKQWGNFWKGSNYFSAGNVPPTGVYSDPNAMLYNTVGNNNAAINAYNTNKDGLKNTYDGEWGDDAHNYFYNKTLGSAYTPEQLHTFGEREKGGWFGDLTTQDPAGYDAWKEGRKNYATTAGGLYNQDQFKRKTLLAEQPGVNKQMGEAFKNTTAGIFSGLNYQNAYKEPEPITLQQGFQGVQYAQYGDQVQPNLTGYTPGSPTQFNRSNTIPGGDISMKDMDRDLIGIVKGGGKHGLITKLEKGKEYSFGSKSVTELPIEPTKEQPMEYAQFGANIVGLDQLAQQAKDKYLSEIAGDAQYGPERSSIEFNNRMQRANDNAAAHSSGAYYQQGVPIGTPAEEYNPYGFVDGATAPQVGQNPMQTAGMKALINSGFVPGTLPGMGYKKFNSPIANNGLFPQQAAYTQPLPGDTTGYNPGNFKIKKGGTQKVAEYQQMLREKGYNIEVDGAWGPKTKAAYEDFIGKKAPSKTSVISGKAKVASNMTKAAGTNPAYTGGNSMQLISDPITGEFTLGLPGETAATAGATPQGNSPFSFSGAAGFGSPTGSLANNTMQPSNLTGSYNNPGATSYLDNRAMGVYAPASNNVKGTPIDYPSISEQRGETESRAFGLLKMTPEEAASYDSSFNKLAPTVKNSPSYLKVLDKERQQLGSKINKLNSEINSMEPGVSTTDWQRKNREIKQKELQKLQQELVKIETTYNRKEKQLTSSTDTRYGKNRTKRNEINPKLFGKPVDPRLNKFLNNIGLYQYGGLVSPVPLYQFGGSVNNDYTYPVHPITEEFTEIQTEKGEVVSLPDYTIVNVKADKSHKEQDKDDVTDILPAEAYVFSDDDKMKLSLDDKIGGVAIRDMRLGKSVFEYKENEITAGPTDIYFSKLWGNEKELTPAQLVNKVKKKLEVRDQKNDFFVERANMENKEQRKEYLDIIKALSEYKKPRSKRVPKAQYGMNVSNMNIGLPKMYNQPTNNAIDGILGYSNKAMDPYYGMDNNVKSMYNISSSMDPKLFEDGGSVPEAQFGWLGAGVDAIGGWSARAKRRQEQENQRNLGRYNELTGEYIDSVERTGAIDTGGALASYMAALNVPDLAYNDNSAALATMSDSYNRQNAMLNAQKYSAVNGAGSAASLARYTNPNTMGAYLAAMQGNTDQQVAAITDRQAQLEANRAGTIADLQGRGIDNYNTKINTERTQEYNANVSGVGGVGRAASTANANLGNARYQTGIDTLSYEAYLDDKAQAAFDKSRSKIEGYAQEIGGGVAMALGVPGFGGNKKDKTGSNNSNNNSQGFYSNFNPNQTSSINDRYNENYNGFSAPPLPGYSYSADMVNRDNVWDTSSWGFNPLTGQPLNRR